jgi:hypothetical protein
MLLYGDARHGPGVRALFAVLFILLGSRMTWAILCPTFTESQALN